MKYEWELQTLKDGSCWVLVRFGDKGFDDADIGWFYVSGPAHERHRDEFVLRFPLKPFAVHVIPGFDAMTLDERKRLVETTYHLTK